MKKLTALIIASLISCIAFAPASAFNLKEHLAQINSMHTPGPGWKADRFFYINTARLANIEVLALARIGIITKNGKEYTKARVVFRVKPLPHKRKKATHFCYIIPKQLPNNLDCYLYGMDSLNGIMIDSEYHFPN